MKVFESQYSDLCVNSSVFEGLKQNILYRYCVPDDPDRTRDFNHHNGRHCQVSAIVMSDVTSPKRVIREGTSLNDRVGGSVTDAAAGEKGRGLPNTGDRAGDDLPPFSVIRCVGYYAS